MNRARLLSGKGDGLAGARAMRGGSFMERDLGLTGWGPTKSGLGSEFGAPFHHRNPKL